LSVFALALATLTVVRAATKRLPRNTRHIARKLPCSHYTWESALTATIKLAVVVILFVYPALCSKVFLTYKCVEVNGTLLLVADMAYACFEGGLG
jgi:hypothetical protein|tara:strand:- start:771 stop:1055 length:285 start_codon:yes stop_codon:yes gene_type:complete